MANRRPRKRISILWSYPITVAICAVGVLFYVLLYDGSGALSLMGEADILTPALQEPAETDDPLDMPATETPQSDIMASQPSPSPAPSMEGRLIPFLFGELWGYKNTEGQQVIEPKYLRALEFRQGLYAFAATERNGVLLYGMITRSGVWAVEPAWSDVRSFSDGLAAVEMNGKWGYIDETGKLVIACAYREAGDFHDGRAAVRSGEDYGYIDPDGDMAIRAAFSKAGDFSSSMAFVMQSGKCYTIDKVGQKITSWENDRGEVYSEGYAAVSSGGSYSYYDTNRKRKYKDFQDARPFSGKMAAVKKDGLWGYINSSGSMVIEPGYQDAGQFAQNRAAVQDSSGKWAYISETGELLTEFLYDEAGMFALDVAIVKLNGKTGIINKMGEYTELY